MQIAPRSSQGTLPARAAIRCAPMPMPLKTRSACDRSGLKPLRVASVSSPGRHGHGGRGRAAGGGSDGGSITTRPMQSRGRAGKTAERLIEAGTSARQNSRVSRPGGRRSLSLIAGLPSVSVPIRLPCAQALQVPHKSSDCSGGTAQKAPAVAGRRVDRLGRSGGIDIARGSPIAPISRSGRRARQAPGAPVRRMASRSISAANTRKPARGSEVAPRGRSRSDVGHRGGPCEAGAASPCVLPSCLEERGEVCRHGLERPCRRQEARRCHGPGEDERVAGPCAVDPMAVGRRVRYGEADG